MDLNNLPKMTFAEFRATGRDVDDLEAVLQQGVEEIEGKPGRVYCGDMLYIEREPNGRYSLTIGNGSWCGEPLETLELRLFEYGDGEFFEADVS